MLKFGAGDFWMAPYYCEKGETNKSDEAELV